MQHVKVRNLDSGDAEIVHVIGAIAAGGAERFVVNLACELARQGRRVELWSMSNRTEPVTSAFQQQLREAGVVLRHGPTGRIGVRTVFWFRRLLRAIQPGVLHLHTPNTELLHFLTMLLSTKKRRVFRTLHSSAVPQKAFQKLVFLHATYERTVACGTAVFSKFSGLGFSRLTTIRNGVAFHWPIQTPEIRSKIRAQLGISNGVKVFVAIGRMDGANLVESPKGHNSLIAAWKQSHIARVYGELHFIGDGPLKSALQSLVPVDATIRFHGIQPEPHNWLLAADCFVMPSRWEGLPVAGIEGIGTGLHCILSDIPPLRELHPPYVRWFNVDDVTELATAMDNACGMHELPDYEAIMRFRRDFSIAICANKYLALYFGGGD